MTQAQRPHAHAAAMQQLAPRKESIFKAGRVVHHACRIPPAGGDPQGRTADQGLRHKQIRGSSNPFSRDPKGSAFTARRVPLLCEQCRSPRCHSPATLLTEQWHTENPTSAVNLAHAPADHLSAGPAAVPDLGDGINAAIMLHCLSMRSLGYTVLALIRSYRQERRFSYTF